jgi:hypothetical protein
MISATTPQYRVIEATSPPPIQQKQPYYYDTKNLRVVQ